MIIRLFLLFKLFFWLTIITLFTQKALHAQHFAISKTASKKGFPSDSYKSFTFNGAWCWFSDPRAVYYEGKHKRTYAGWVDNYGDIHVAYYDHDTHNIHSKVIADNLEINDHNNPSLLFDDDGRLIVFYNTHMIGIKPLYMIRAKKPENIDQWGKTRELFLNNRELEDMGLMYHTYTNPVRLSEENGRIYLFWRGVDGKPSYSFSDDNGDTWITGRIFFMPERTYSYRRPYTKVYSKGINKIHFVVTDGHPRKEERNSIYYFYYQAGAFYKADGSKIKDIEDGPIIPYEADLVYDASDGRAWNWDIAEDEKGNPVIAFVKFPDDENHMYCYARYKHKSWHNYDLVNSGKWFPETFEGKTEPEPNYSGGMTIDHDNPDILYLSVNRDSVFEIEKWSTENKGKSWKITPVTQGSDKDNVRPFAVRNATQYNPIQVLWMQNTQYHHYNYGHPQTLLARLSRGFNERFHTSIKMNIPSETTNNMLTKEGIIDIMRRLADWQLSNPFYLAENNSWHYDALFPGLYALYDITGETRYLNEMYNIGQIYNGNVKQDHILSHLTVSDTYSWLMNINDKPTSSRKTNGFLNYHLSTLYEKIKRKHIDNLTQTWVETTRHMYSSEDSLYHLTNALLSAQNSEDSVFWSKYNGWLLAGLVRILQITPSYHPDYDKLMQQYLEVAHKILHLQGKDGLWRVSLEDPDYLNIGESCGSSFFTFALAWGMNNNLIDQYYRPFVEKAWKALCNNVDNNGRLRFTLQPVGNSSPFNAFQWQAYATGAFLLAGSEMYEMVKR